MTDRSVAFYPFPDDGSQTLHRVISRLPMEHRRAMRWRPTEDWLLEVPPHIAEAVSGLFSHAGVHQLDPSWKAGALLVPDVVRAAVEGVLNAVQACGRWSQVEGVEFDSSLARLTFEAAL